MLRPEHVGNTSVAGRAITLTSAKRMPNWGGSVFTIVMENHIHDAWAAREVPKILASDAYKRGGVLFLLWDEGSSSGDDPPFIVASPVVKHGYGRRYRTIRARIY